jgi:hypothetical protein
MTTADMTTEHIKAELEKIESYAMGRLDEIEDMRQAGHAITTMVNSLKQLRARLSGMAAVQWQPIETAPKTGDPLLLRWRFLPSPKIGRYSCDEHFAERPRGWASPEYGWRCDGDECIPSNQHHCTHWMPLPSVQEPLHG